MFTLVEIKLKILKLRLTNSKLSRIAVVRRYYHRIDSRREKISKYDETKIEMKNGAICTNRTLYLDFCFLSNVTSRFSDSLLTLIKGNLRFLRQAGGTGRSRNTEQVIVFISVLKAFYLIAASTYNAYP